MLEPLNTNFDVNGYGLFNLRLPEFPHEPVRNKEFTALARFVEATNAKVDRINFDATNIVHTVFQQAKKTENLYNETLKVHNLTKAIVATPGPQGPTGPAGSTGARGPSGVQGPVGPQGATGAGLNILGVLTSQSELPASGDPASGYVIDGELFVWNGVSWNNTGALVNLPPPGLNPVALALVFGS
jgi:hypothetical protein